MSAIRGVILVVVLLFLQIVAILGLFAIKLVWLETKESQSVLHQHLLDHSADQAMRRIEAQVTQGFLKCVVPPMSTGELLARPSSWWQTEACVDAILTFKYYYIVEFLAEDPCAEIQLQPHIITANYFRITLLEVGDTAKNMVQSSVITKNRNLLSCQGIRHSVVLGRQMWRKIKT